MNWDAIGAIAEAAGAIAVLITLIYLARQIRYANKQSEIEAFRHTWDGLNQFCDLIAQNPETATILRRGRESLASLDRDERLVFEHIHIRLLNTLESWHLQIQETSRPGDYQTTQLNNLASIAEGYFSQPGTRELWSEFRHYFVPISGLIDRALAEEHDEP